MDYIWLIVPALVLIIGGYFWFKTRSIKEVRNALRRALPALRIIAAKTTHTEIDDKLVKLIERLVGDDPTGKDADNS